MRILVADDDPDFVAMLRKFLEREGHHCSDVPDAGQAIAKLTEVRFDLLFADIDMPGNRSLELVEALAGMADRPPVVLLTGSPSMSTAVKSVGLPVMAYVTKPFDPEYLRRLIGEAETNNRVHRAVAGSEERIRGWAADLARIRETMQHPPEVAGGVQSYIVVTLGNLVAAVGDIAEVIDVMSRTGRHQDKIQVASLLTAVRETITVLESTRSVFKSKELGVLRKKLEELVR